jgi:hypothetical protein
MIHIIGTRHSLQCWSDAIRNGVDCDADSATVERFEHYLQEVAGMLHATVIAEELSQENVEQRQGGASVAKQVADRMGLRHLFCDANRRERESLGISTHDARECVWVSRIQPLLPNNISMVFVCGADHSQTFKATLENCGLHVRVHCDDWTLEADGGGRQRG